MSSRRPVRATLIAAGLLAVVAGCGSAAPASPARATPAAGPAPAAATGTAAVCGNLLKLDAVPPPESGPEGPPPADAVKEYGAAAAPLVEAALGDAPAALAGPLKALQPIVTAAGRGVAPEPEDPAFTGAVAGYETWAHDNCGYQNVDLAGTDFRFTGAPTTLDAGPASFQLRNQSTSGQFHVALLARPKDGSVTLEKFLATPMEGLLDVVDLVPGGAAAAPGGTGGMLVDLEPGRYFLLCPVGDEGTLPHHLQGMITEVTVV